MRDKISNPELSSRKLAQVLANKIVQFDFARLDLACEKQAGN